jgi:hypothetical protein
MTLRLSTRGRLSEAGGGPHGLKLQGIFFAGAFLVLALSFGCKVDERQSGIPSEAQEAINSFSEDFNAGRFDKIYRETADEWRAQVTPEQSNEIFQKLKERLGPVKERTFTSGRQQQKGYEKLPANSLVIRYNTKFERSEGMETFTLIERDGRYQLGGYSVSSDVLK